MAAGYLLDTNVISETRRSRPDEGVLAFLASVDSNSLFVSVLTMGELRKGVAAKRRADPRAADGLGQWVDEIETSFSDRILPITAAIARGWAEQTAGRTLPVIDTLIAATAIAHDLALVTRDTKATKETGVRLINPWR